MIATPTCFSIMVYMSRELPGYTGRSPKRITITIPYSTFDAIVRRSNDEGRSLSNLAAFILEQGIQN